MKSIRVDRASEHNLKDVSLEIPRDALTVFTGVSGSGKSSLAFDTIYREGQRRFLESLSAYSRQFLGGLEQPKVDHVEGLSPTHLRSTRRPSGGARGRPWGRSRRSTTTSGSCAPGSEWLTARPAAGWWSSQSAEQIWDRVLARHSGRTALVCAPVAMGRRGEHQQVLEDLRRDGHLRVRIDGRLYKLRDGFPPLRRGASHTVEVVWDRLEVDARNRSRWIEAIEKSVELAGGVVSVVVADAPSRAGDQAPAAEDDAGEDGVGVETRDLFSSELACPACAVDLPGAGAVPLLVQLAPRGVPPVSGPGRDGTGQRGAPRHEPQPPARKRRDRAPRARRIPLSRQVLAGRGVGSRRPSRLHPRLELGRPRRGEPAVGAPWRPAVPRARAHRGARRRRRDEPVARAVPERRSLRVLRRLSASAGSEGRPGGGRASTRSRG